MLGCAVLAAGTNNLVLSVNKSMLVLSVNKGGLFGVQIVKSKDVTEVVNKNKRPWYVTTEKDTEDEVKNRPAFFELDQLLTLLHPKNTKKSSRTRTLRTPSSRSSVNSSRSTSPPEDTPSSVINSVQLRRANDQRIRESDRREENIRIQQEINEHAAQSAILTKKLEAEKKRKNSNEKEMKTIKTQNSTLRSRISDLSAEKEKHRSKVKSAKQSAKRFKLQLDDYQSVALNLEDELGEASEKSVRKGHAAQKEFQTLQDHAAQKELQTMQDRLATMQVEAAKQKLIEMTDRVETANRKKKILKTTNDELRALVVQTAAKERTETDGMQTRIVEEQRKVMDRMAEQNQTHIRDTG